MQIRNIWKEVLEPLELHEDDRGRIVDVFYHERIEHVAVIDSNAGALRGNHYHKETTQHMLMTRGSMEYWYKPVDSKEAAKHVVVRTGDLVSTPPLEIHALKILEESQFVVFSTGVRGGKDYESDTYRVQSIFPADYA
jgi:dTDP-4-dehydrorhamnose 3,5-epimerase-like enzyme